MKLYLSPDMENEANEVQMQHSNIFVDPIMEDIEMYLEREVPMQYANWMIPTRLAYQKGAYSEPNSTMTSLNMVCARQIIEELPNDLVRRNPFKYTSQYINRLMSMIPNWKRSEQEKVKGLHSAYCDKTGRTKYPWVRMELKVKNLVRHCQVNWNCHSNFKIREKKKLMSPCPFCPRKRIKIGSKQNRKL